MLDDFDPGLPMMVAILVGMFVTIVYIDVSSRDFSATAFTAIIGFFVVLGVLSFRYHCVAKVAIQSDREIESDRDVDAGTES